MSPLLESFSTATASGSGFQQTNINPITNGLVLWWDFANPNSYTAGSGTIADLSKNNNNGTISNPNSGTFANGTYLFNGTTSNTFVCSSINLVSSDYTIIGSTRLVGSQNGRSISGYANNWLIGNWGGNVSQYYAEGWVYGAGQAGQYLYTGVDTNWHIWTATGRGNYSAYNNNQLLGTNTAGTAGPNGLCSYYGPGNSEQSINYMGFLLCYNRALTAAELTQTYNSYKGRYGLT
jgi:hypothetical protein